VSAARRSYVPWIIGAAVIVVALIGAIMIAATRSDDDGGDPAAIVETNAVVVDGASLPELTDVDAAVGAPAPQATGTGFDGLRVELLADGEPTVIGFFAHWCPVCQGEVDELADHLADGGLPDDVRVVAVSTSVRPEEDNYPPSAWFADEQWPTPILLDDADSRLAQAYGLSAFPFWVVVDADGSVVGRVSGAIGPSQFDALVDIARNGAPT
jgi:cytochrome c biogenesis protein CcmG/thiol:disulfide interchange protein DsbE